MRKITYMPIMKPHMIVVGTTLLTRIAGKMERVVVLEVVQTEYGGLKYKIRRETQIDPLRTARPPTALKPL